MAQIKQADQVQEVSSLYGDSCFSAGGALLRKAANDLSDVELVAILFGIDKPDAQTWLYQVGGLRPLVESSALGKALIEFSSRYLFEKCKRGDVLSDPDAVRSFLASKLRDLKAEKFCVVFLDNRHRVIAYEEMFDGTIDGASVHPREVVRSCLHHNAAAVVFAHNHPSSVAEPSQADERITQ